MASLRDILRRIRSVKNTQQITKAMKAVSASKLRKAQAAMMAARPYANKMVAVLGNLASRAPREYHPLLAHRGSRRVEFVILTSDRGLCSSFNTNIMKRTVALFNEKKADNCDITLNVIGRKGRDYLKRRHYEVRKDWTGISGHLSYSHASMIGQEIIENYVNADVDEVYVIYNEFKSAMAQVVKAEKLLPIETPESSVPAGTLGDYIYEASELGARMSAMDSASNNAKEMIAKLTLKYNKARQAAITKELMEIIGGAEALK
jgi:F-type H+-transporting ATPase subunit gamma